MASNTINEFFKTAIINKDLDHTNIEDIKIALQNIFMAELVELWNEYLEVNRYDSYIYYLEENSLNSMYSSAADFAQKVMYEQQFRWTDDFFYVNDSGEPFSFNYRDDENCPIDIDDLANWLIEQY